MHLCLHVSKLLHIKFNIGLAMCPPSCKLPSYSPPTDTESHAYGANLFNYVMSVTEKSILTIYRPIGLIIPVVTSKDSDTVWVWIG